MQIWHGFKLQVSCLQELETNEEYVEREDEFDVNESSASPTANR